MQNIFYESILTKVRNNIFYKQLANQIERVIDNNEYENIHFINGYTLFEQYIINYNSFQNNINTFDYLDNNMKDSVYLTTIKGIKSERIQIFKEMLSTKDLYGIVLKDQTGRIETITHPLTNIDKYIDSNYHYQAFIYIFPNFDNLFKEYEYEFNILYEFIKALKLKEYILDKNNNIKMIFNGNSVSIIDNNNLLENKQLIIKMDIINKNVFYPIYGALLYLEHNKAMNLFYISSCNIRSDKICTGSLDNRTLRGLNSLSHSNENSRFQESKILSSYMPFAKACIEYTKKEFNEKYNTK